MIAIMLLLFALLTFELAVEGPVGFWWERGLTRFLIGLWTTEPVEGGRHLSHLSFGWVAVAAAAVSALALCLLRRCWRAAAALALSPLVVLSVPVLKALFKRPPPDSQGMHIHSFPSGHATGTMVVAAASAAVLWHTRWRWLALATGAVLVLGVGAAVVAGSGHWPSDVVAGWALACGWVALCQLVLSALGPRSATAAESAPPRAGPVSPAAAPGWERFP